MKYVLLFLLGTVAMGMGACDEAQRPVARLVADGTPFLVSTLETTPDTTFRHTEVFVGKLFDPLKRYSLLLEDDPQLAGMLDSIEHVTLWAQVAGKLNTMSLRVEPFAQAEVQLEGPLGRPESQKVRLRHAVNGIYRDLDRRVTVVPEGRYRLTVAMDGKTYGAETTVPAAVALNLAPVYPVRVTRPYAASPTYERHADFDSVMVPVPRGGYLMVFGANGSRRYDACVEYQNPTAVLPDTRRGDWLREPFVGYRMRGVAQGAVPYYFSWVAEAKDCPRYDRVSKFVRVSFTNEDLGRYYHVERKVNDVSRDDPYAPIMREAARAGIQRDTSYLPGLSNWRRVDASGQPIAASRGEALGVFGAYSSRYLKTTVVPVRDYDPCLLWPGTAPCGANR